MREFTIRLRSVQDVQDFVSLSTAQPFSVEVTDGRYTASGRSFMNLFCLELTAPLTVHVACDSSDALTRFCREASRFKAD